MKSTEVIKLVEEAFANVRLGNGIGLRQAQAIDDYKTNETVQKSRELDEKNDWKNIKPELLDKCYSSLSFFDAEGMRFHIPAFMICDLKGLLNTADPVFYLWHGLDVKRKDSEKSYVEEENIKWWNYANERFGILNTEQRTAIKEFLKYKIEQGLFYKDEIERALENYWNR